MYSLRNLFCVLVIVTVAHQSTWALVGDSCTSSGCIGDMLCESGKCACPRDRVPTPDRTRCLIVATNVGAGCELQEQCNKLSDYTICLDFKCTCKENASIVNGVCEKRRELGERCSNDEQCQHINDAACKDSLCACNDMFVPRSTDSQMCIAIATNFQSPCEEDIQCSKGIGDNAFCRDARCQCGEEYHGSNVYSAKCVLNKGLTDSCEPGQCYLPLDGDNQNIDCVENTCKCKGNVEGVHNSDGKNDTCSGAASLRSLTLLSGVWLIVMGVTRNFV